MSHELFDNLDDPRAPSSGNVDRSTRRQNAAPFPTLCTVMFGVEIGFAVLRGVILAFTLLMLKAIQQQLPNDPMAATYKPEMAMNGLLFAFGLLANVSLIFRQRWAVALGWVVALASVGSLGVAVWQASIMFAQTNDQATRAGMMFGLVFILTLRLCLLALYASARTQFSSWWRNRDEGL